jgi:hypothetical protein
MGRRKKRPNAGQPRKWESPEKLDADIKEYFEYCRVNKRPLTIAGMAAYLGCDRQTIYNYSYKDEYFDVIKKARNKIIAYIEEELMIKGTAGQIFVAKQYGYKDTQEIITHEELDEDMEEYEE